MITDKEIPIQVRLPLLLVISKNLFKNWRKGFQQKYIYSDIFSYTIIIQDY